MTTLDEVRGENRQLTERLFLEWHPFGWEVLDADNEHERLFSISHKHTDAEIELAARYFLMAWDQGFKRGADAGKDMLRRDLGKLLGFGN